MKNETDLTEVAIIVSTTQLFSERPDGDFDGVRPLGLCELVRNIRAKRPDHSIVLVNAATTLPSRESSRSRPLMTIGDVEVALTTEVGDFDAIGYVFIYDAPPLGYSTTLEWAHEKWPVREDLERQGIDVLRKVSQDRVAPGSIARSTLSALMPDGDTKLVAVLDSFSGISGVVNTLSSYCAMLQNADVLSYLPTTTDKHSATEVARIYVKWHMSSFALWGFGDGEHEPGEESTDVYTPSTTNTNWALSNFVMRTVFKATKCRWESVTSDVRMGGVRSSEDHYRARYINTVALAFGRTTRTTIFGDTKVAETLASLVRTGTLLTRKQTVPSLSLFERLSWLVTGTSRHPMDDGYDKRTSLMIYTDGASKYPSRPGIEIKIVSAQRALISLVGANSSPSESNPVPTVDYSVATGLSSLVAALAMTQKGFNMANSVALEPMDFEVDVYTILAPCTTLGTPE